MFELRQLFNLRKTLGKDELQISQHKVVRIELGMKPCWQYTFEYQKNNDYNSFKKRLNYGLCKTCTSKLFILVMIHMKFL